MKWLYRQAFKFILKQHQLWLGTNGKKGTRLDFSSEFIPQSAFDNADMRNSAFNCTILSNSSFNSAHLVQARLHHANLSHADFSNADFFKTNMTEARLRGVKLNIHVENRQKEDLESMKNQAEKLWPVLEHLQKDFNNPDTHNFRHDLSCFLNNNKVRRPRETIPEPGH